MGKKYRGYVIKPKEEGGYGVYSGNGYLVISQSTEQGCISWIDSAKESAQHKRDLKKARVRERIL